MHKTASLAILEQANIPYRLRLLLKRIVISDIDAVSDTVSFTNGVELKAGEATGDVNELSLRRLQIREAIRAHFEKESVLFHQGIKVLSLFFIDEVAKYRQYDENGEVPGDYAKIFEEEYRLQMEDNFNFWYFNFWLISGTRLLSESKKIIVSLVTCSNLAPEILFIRIRNMLR